MCIRDRRISDLQQIQLALRAYAEQYGEYPCQDHTICNSPVQTQDANGPIGVGGYIDELLAPFMGSVPADPLHDGLNDGFQYYYDPSHYCARLVRQQAVILATSMERPENQNMIAGPCDDGTDVVNYGYGGDSQNARRHGHTASHYIIVGRSPDTYE